jgi:hypothetical protein
MLRAIEGFRRDEDGPDWSPSVDRARAEACLPNGFTLVFGPGPYRFTRTIALVRGMGMTGAGASGDGATRLEFPAGVPAISCEPSRCDAALDRRAHSLVARVVLAAAGRPATAAPAIVGDGLVLDDVRIEGFCEARAHAIAEAA